MSVDLHLGDCLEILPTIAENSVDTCITDPPYGLEFMGKNWDHGIPGVPFWKAVLRVLKPGAMLLAFGGTRTHHRLMCAIEDAGFEIRDCIMWVYGSGFPKSHDISKAIDKAGGGTGMPKTDREKFARELREKREGAGISRSELASWFPQYTEVTNNWERTDSGFRIPSASNYQILVERLGISKKWKLRVHVEDKRQLISQIKTDRRKDGTILGLGHSGKKWESTTPVAQLWDGWGTALKPAWEPIIVAMKPRDGTFAQNALEHGVAGIWVDGSRVPTEGEKISIGFKGAILDPSDGWNSNSVNRTPYDDTKGRWPANLIHDGSDEVLVRFSNHAARFFYCAKAAKHERWFYCTLCDDAFPASDKDDHKHGKENQEHIVFHPTQKPLTLMEYLVRLTKTPTNGSVIDPFMGTGTTGEACVNEGRDFIGCDIERPSYIVTKRSIELAQEEAFKPKQKELFA